MDATGPLLLLTTGIASLSLAVGYVIASWRAASRSTRSRKVLPSPPPMSDFETRFAKVEAEQVELFSTLQKLTTSMRRLSSRAGMQDLRERQRSEAPPLGTPKAQLREFYGVNGKTHADVARMHNTNNVERGSEE